MDFNHSGLLSLRTVNWQSEQNRRSILASLVKGVYVMESDRQHHRQAYQALAPVWWKSFNFQLSNVLTDDKDSSIFGAVYQLKPNPNNFYPIGAPRYVIAFRGTMLSKYNIIQDGKLDLKILTNKLHNTGRFEKAMQAVQNMVDEKGACNIWLAGHSLGASIAMLSGKTMAKEGIVLESYLYNPPFIAAHIESIKSKKVKRVIFGARSLFTEGLTISLNDEKEKQQSKDLFTTLSLWVPNLFLNPSDPICSGYIRYFDKRETMESSGFQGIERLETEDSSDWLLSNDSGNDYCSEELHLIPSACVTTSRTPIQQAHNLSQWFTNYSVSEPKLYSYE
ncbi:hypothetical protein MKW94_025303 [Papaver nudicaule]|uniref:Fungal lipase-type domain-containing protein n=1 Tax=Papaver nudicaule TaxID=74823 RepID=A0AA41VVC6_PAPNU|nr:hypothetical protein [Papaver nudicaule]